MRTSRLATFVEVTIVPIHCFPGRMFVSFIQTAMMRGGALGGSVCGVGQTVGATTTPPGSSMWPGGEPHPVKSAIAASASLPITLHDSPHRAVETPQ